MQYNHFFKGLVSLYDPTLKRYTSEYLDGSVYKRTKANTVQALFPILLTDIPQEHKDSIISMLKDVNIFIIDLVKTLQVRLPRPHSLQVRPFIHTRISS